MKPSQVRYSLSSRSPDGVIMRSVGVRYWRGILAEVNTHRALSKSSSSSRAIPVKKMLRQVVFDTAGPTHWGANQPGMQAQKQLTGWRLWVAKRLWKSAAFFAAFHSWAMMKVGLHKQVANRVTEPFQWSETIISGTDWENLFHLRDHPDSQPEFRELVRNIKKQFDSTEPVLLKSGQWHLPYITQEDRNQMLLDKSTASDSNEILRKISAARCARVSYLNHDGSKPDISKDLGLYERLAGTQPIHASPLEHQATPDRKNHREWIRPDLHGNLHGWVQSRKMIPGETAKDRHYK